MYGNVILVYVEYLCDILGNETAEPLVKVYTEVLNKSIRDLPLNSAKI